MKIRDDALEALRRYFDKVHLVGLKLPNGWFGRPYDNWHQLSRLRLVDDGIEIELDGRLNLTFEGSPRAIAQGQNLVLGDFELLSWDWTEYGSDRRHHVEFNAGLVEFVGPAESAKGA